LEIWPQSPQRQLGDGSGPTYIKQPEFFESPQRQLGDGSGPTYIKQPEFFESPQRQLGDCSSPAFVLEALKVGFEQSTDFRRWYSVIFCCSS